ncbi:MAG: hypothetical protein WAU00_02920 [Caldilinea sp.]
MTNSDSTHRNQQTANIILLTNRPRMMREMMHRALKKLPETHYVFEFGEHENLRELVDILNARWLVVSRNYKGQLSPDVEEVMRQHPGLHVMAVSNDGDYVDVFTTPKVNEWERVSLPNPSLGDLLNVLGKS